MAFLKIVAAALVGVVLALVLSALVQALKAAIVLARQRHSESGGILTVSQGVWPLMAVAALGFLVACLMQVRPGWPQHAGGEP